MREGKKHPFAINVWRWGLLILLLVLWEIGARLKWIDPFFFSSPLEIARTAVIKWQGGTLWRDIAYTGASTLLGFVLGTVIGSIVGLLFWFSRPVAQVAEPWLIVLNALPKLALAPVLVIWFGIGFLFWKGFWTYYLRCAPHAMIILLVNEAIIPAYEKACFGGRVAKK